MEKKSNAGRKLRLNSEMIKLICDYIATGNTQKDACILAGISTTIFHAWRNKGADSIKRKKRNIFTEFVKALKKAEIEFKDFHIQQVNNASKQGNWTASAWMLERRYNKEFGRKDRNVIEGKLNFTLKPPPEDYPEDEKKE